MKCVFAIYSKNIAQMRVEYMMLANETIEIKQLAVC